MQGDVSFTTGAQVFKYSILQHQINPLATKQASYFIIFSTPSNLTSNIQQHFTTVLHFGNSTIFQIWFSIIDFSSSTIAYLHSNTCSDLSSLVQKSGPLGSKMQVISTLYWYQVEMNFLGVSWPKQEFSYWILYYYQTLYLKLYQLSLPVLLPLIQQFQIPYLF